MDRTALEYRQGTYDEPHDKSQDTLHVIWSTLCLPSPMIAPDDYMAHLKSLDKFHRTLQCPPLLSLHRMGLPSSDSVAETFLQLSTLPLAIDSSQHCAVTSLLWHMSSGSPIQTDTETLVSPVESVDTHLTLGVEISPGPQGTTEWVKTVTHMVVVLLVVT